MTPEQIREKAQDAAERVFRATWKIGAGSCVVNDRMGYRDFTLLVNAFEEAMTQAYQAGKLDMAREQFDVIYEKLPAFMKQGAGEGQ